MSLKINLPFPNMNLNYLWMNWQMAEENNEIQRLQNLHFVLLFDARVC